MIRLMVCCRLRPDIDTNVFRQFWGQELMASLRQIIADGIVDGVAPSLGLDIERNRGIGASLGTQPPFDAVVEIFWDSGHALEAAQENPEFVGALGRLMLRMRDFADVGDCVLSYTEAPVELQGDDSAGAGAADLAGYRVIEDDADGG